MLHVYFLCEGKVSVMTVNKIILVVTLFIFSTEAHASVYKGLIEKMIVGRQGHQVFVHIKGAPQTCGLDHSLGFNYAISLRDHGAGRSIYSTMLAAQMAGREITIQGDGVCTITPEMEDIGYVYIH
jgi:hypothetical protein